MMMPKKKNVASIIVSKMVNHDPIVGESESEEIKKKEGTQDFEPGLEAACEDILVAIETKNIKLLMAALEDHHRLLDDKIDAEEGENDDYSSSNEGIG